MTQNEAMTTDVTEISNQISALQKQLDDITNKAPDPELEANRFQSTKTNGIQCHVGAEVIVRTYSAGVWFGVLAQKCGKEVILDRARRMWRWQCAESISLSGVARHGMEQSKSKIAGPVDGLWLEAIEIIPVYGTAATSIRDAGEAEAN